jgi:galactokinase
MVGGCFGGSAIALIKADQIETVKESIKSAYAQRNLKAPRFFTSLPSAGAKASLNPH